MTTAIVDMDVILHRAASSAQAVYRFDGGAECVSTDFAAAKARAQSILQEWVRPVFPDRIVLALSDPTGNYWRKAVLPSYKAHRSGTAKPLLFKNLRAWAEEEYECVCKDGLEADDVCGILSTHPTKYPGLRVIVGADKDFLQIPGLLYRPHRPKQGIIEITEAEADRWHLIQTLTGDPTDGFYGIKGIGPKKAEKILGEKGGWMEVTAAYKRAGLSYLNCLTQARVARILRFGDYHQGLGVRLWTPQQETQ